METDITTAETTAADTVAEQAPTAEQAVEVADQQENTQETSADDAAAAIPADAVPAESAEASAPVEAEVAPDASALGYDGEYPSDSANKIQALLVQDKVPAEKVDALFAATVQAGDTSELSTEALVQAGVSERNAQLIQAYAGIALREVQQHKNAVNAALEHAAGGIEAANTIAEFWRESSKTDKAMAEQYETFKQTAVKGPTEAAMVMLAMKQVWSQSNTTVPPKLVQPDATPPVSGPAMNYKEFAAAMTKALENNDQRGVAAARAAFNRGLK